MKFAPTLLASISALAFTLSASAGQTISVEAGPAYGGDNPYQSQGGGEFTAFASTGIPAGYASDATLTLNGQTGFETFCILPTVDIGFGNTYSFQAGPNVLVPTSGDSAAGANSVALSNGTAWLYAQFATGQLNGYDYADTGNNRINTASELQQALWFFQGETYEPTNDPFVSDALAEFGGSLTLAQSAETPYEFGTDALNIYTTNANGSPDTLQQGMLVYGTPDVASTALLLGGGLLVLVAARKRLGLQAI